MAGLAGLIQFLLECLEVAFFFHGFMYLYAKLQPQVVSLDMIGREDLFDMPLRSVAILYAMVTGLVGLNYYTGVLGEDFIYHTKQLADAYLIFDGITRTQVWNNVSRKSAVQPMGIALHHIATFSWMHGLFVSDTNWGAASYFLSELPIVTLQLTHFVDNDNPLSTSRIKFGLMIVTSVLYVLTRVVMFPLVFIFCIFPHTNIFNFFYWGIYVFFLVVYAFNIGWCISILEKTFQVDFVAAGGMSIYGDSLTSLTSLTSLNFYKSLLANIYPNIGSTARTKQDNNHLV